MKLFDKLTESTGVDSPLLQATKLITPDDVRFDKSWGVMSGEYEGAQELQWSTKAIVSLLNALVYQRRTVFILTRAGLRDLLRSDKNWKESIGLKNGYYPKFLKSISGFIEVVGKAPTTSGRMVYIYKVKSPDVRALITGAGDAEQLKQCFQFLKGPEVLKEAEDYTGEVSLYKAPMVVS